MGSTVCVRCGATLLPHSYCEVCQDVLYFICSSCSMFTDERIHIHCRNTDIQNDNSNIRKLVQIPNSSQIVLDDRYHYVQNHFNEEIKYNSINLFTSYWDNIFYSFRLVNRYWKRIFDISNPSQNILWK
jgi:hypothetical protein